MENANNNPSKPEEKKTDNKSKDSDLLKSYKFRLAVALIVIYIVSIIYLANKVEIDDKFWSRFLFLFSGLEAIVFTAVGYVFGRDVSRKAEQNAEKKAKNSENEKVKAEKEKAKAEKDAQKNKENTIRLQEAVLAEKELFNLSKNSNLSNLFSFQESTESYKSKPVTFKSRAITLANRLQYGYDSGTTISFEYSVEADDFNEISIDGDSKYSKSGFFSSVYAYGNYVEVEIDRDNFKTWKFTATDITDEDGREMKMSNSPLESNGNKASFRIEYK